MYYLYIKYRLIFKFYMTRSRNQIIVPESTKYYHCISRCVRRAFLCGEDKNTGKNYDYRRSIIEKEMLKYSRIFCLNVYSYCVMSNHTHILLEIDDIRAFELSHKQVLKDTIKFFSQLRLKKIFQGIN